LRGTEDTVADQRIKGQEVEVLMVLNGSVQNTITDVRSFEIAIQTELLREGYLGEKTDRRDEKFNGVRGRMELHYENKDIFDLIQSIVDRATRQSPGTKINVKATLNFPNGDRPRVLISDVYFGEVPLSFGGRGEYGTVALEFEASGYKTI
jgi:hypothetical protein